MSEETTSTEETEETSTEETEETSTEETEEWTPPTQEEWTKLQSKATRREKLLRERQEEIARLKGGKGKDEEKSEDEAKAEKFRNGLVRTAARASLAVAGVTDKEDQTAVLSILRMDGIEVDEDGEVDTDALEERIADLRRIFGGTTTTTTKKLRRDPQDKGGRGGGTTDPDSNRYQRFMRTGR